MKSRLQSGNTYYNSVQNLLSSGLLSKNIKIKNIQNCNVRVVLCGYEAWYLTFRQERSLKVLGE
jgi:hypothetical protein